MITPNKLNAVLLSSFVMLILSLIPFLNLINLICCAGIIIGGASGTLYYARQCKATGYPLNNGDGVMIGILGGIISAVIYVIVSTLLIMFTNSNPVEMVYKFTEEYGIEIPPESEKLLKQVYEEYQQKGFSFMMLGVELFIRVISHTLFGAIGGLLVASFFNRNK
ncbi:MAG: DUF4199 family protein [Ignavibacteria bacterium]|nr:DUF4199 family protein [Ignavibacteria bacterium]